LDKENRTDVTKQPEYWFNNDSSNILSDEVRTTIDNNIAKLSRPDAKFFLVNMSPSQKVQRAPDLANARQKFDTII
jgi:hypothetical protein